MILLFKTNIMLEQDMLSVSEELTQLVGRSNWSIDIDDCDKVLRVEAEFDVTMALNLILQRKGFIIETLK